MRVRVVFELDESSEKLDIPAEGSGAEGYVDLRENPRAIERVEPARQHLPLRSFLAAVNGADALFSSVRCATWLTEDTNDATDSCEFASRIDLVFAQASLNLERAAYEDLTQRLQELLLRDASPDTLRVELWVRACHFPALDRAGFCLRLLLHARGATPEQAELRWGLGLARVQQALLFTSRVLRQHREQPS